MSIKAIGADAMTVEFGGHSVVIEDDGSAYATTYVLVPLALVRQLDELHLALGPYLNGSWFSKKFILVDETGGEIVRSLWLTTLARAYERHLREQATERNYDTLAGQLRDCVTEAEALRPMGLYTEPLERALNECRRDLQGLGRVYYGQTSYDKCVASLRRVRRLLDFLSGPFVDVVAQCLLEGSILPVIYAHNHTVRQRVLVDWIRTGGHEIIELPDDAYMLRFYRQQLKGATSMNDARARQAHLMLRLEDFVPGWLLDDPDLKFAPAELRVSRTLRRKGAVTGKEDHYFAVTYSLRQEDDGAQTPIGTVRMPLSLYDAADSIPARLLHDIELVLELTVQEEMVVKGTINNLAERIKRYKGGKQRSRSAPPPGMRGQAVTSQIASGVPPWHKGSVRWR